MLRSSLPFPATLCFATALAAAGCRTQPERRASAADSGANSADRKPEGDAALIDNALSAAPVGIANGATVVLRRDGVMRTLREGSNGWTCFPDNPSLPGNMPMCVDRETRDWFRAFAALQAPPKNRPIGISYLMQGTWFPSADDPSVAPAPGIRGTSTGPMLMIVNASPAMLAGYPKGAANPGAPFVMYSGTPYEHLMIPIERPTR
ncbi:MAG TPA: hypothetical protein VF785_18860 [Gemmatimonadaceae bacterium]